MLRLDLQLFAQEKTEPATPRRRQDARKKGQVAKSPDLAAAVLLLAVLIYFALFGSGLKERLFSLFAEPFIFLSERDDWGSGDVMALFARLAWESAILMLPLLLVPMVFGAAAYVAQVGFLWTAEPLKPNLSKLNPVTGLRHLFSLRSLVQLVKSVLKLVVIGWIAWTTLWDRREHFERLAWMEPQDIFLFSADTVLALGLRVAAALFVLAVLDYAYQRYEHEKQLRMSKEDIKEEIKKQEGDPHVRSKIRERQRRLALMRMMQEVPKADVVITNPTHYAVALRYDASEMDAPKVVAKGAGYVALKIREIAAKHDVAVVENRALARSLYEQAEVGQTIPVELFQAVAEVLAYVYRLKKKVRV